MATLSGTSLQFIETFSNDATVLLDGAEGTTSALVNGTTFVYAYSRTDDAIQIFTMDGNGTLTPVGNITDTGGTSLDGVQTLEAFTVDGNPFLVAGSSVDDGITVFSVSDSAPYLTLADRAFDSEDANTNLDYVTDIEVVTTDDGVTFLYVSGYTSSGVSVFEVDSTGGLTNVQNLDDGTGLELNRPYGLSAFAVPINVVNDDFYLAIASNFDDTLNIFSINEATGELTLVTSYDGGSVPLANPRYLDSVVIDQTTYLYVPESSGDAVRVLSFYGSDLVEVQRIHSPETLDYAQSVHIFEVGDKLLMGVTSRNSHTFALYEIETNSATGRAGELTLLQTAVDNAGEGELRVIDTNTTVEIDGRTFAIASNGFYDSLNVYEIGGADDHVEGTSKGDLLSGLGGADRLVGLGGNDTMLGGDGDDEISAGSGNDSAEGGAGDDVIDGDDGADTLRGGDGDDDLSGGSDNDSLYGGAGADAMDGGDGADWMSGDDGDDALQGGGGADTLMGGAGDDTLEGGDDADRLEGNEGRDDLSGGSGNDTMFGGDGDDDLYGGSGDDSMEGGAGADWMMGHGGADLLRGDAGSDWADGGSGSDTLSGNDGEDTLRGGDDNDAIYGGNDGDAIAGNLGNDYLRGNNGDDAVYGGAGNDDLGGDAGNDTVEGGLGDDLMRGGDDDDLLLGGRGIDTLAGNSGNDTLRGGADNDVIIGGTGTDLMYGDSGADVFVFDNVNQSFHGSARDTIADFTAGVDKVDLSGFAGTLSFVGSYTGAGNEVRYSQPTGRLYIDVDGDGASDFSVDLTGNPALTAGDLIL